MISVNKEKSVCKIIYRRVKMLLKCLLYVVVIGILVVVFLIAKGRIPLYKGPVSEHFDGLHFHYKNNSNSYASMVKWMWEMKTVEWPKWINDPKQAKPIEVVKDGELKVTYINHATMLIQMDGVNILTDPIWSDRAGPVSWLGTKRVRTPGVKLEDLPKIDIVLISHDHYDHLDLDTLEKLNTKYHPQIITGLGVKSILADIESSKVTELDWWGKYKLESHDIKINFVPAKHGSGRMLFGMGRSLWGGFVIESKNGNVYFAGDTGYDDDFVNEIKSVFKKFRLTILPIGSYEKRWYMKSQHINPEDAVKIQTLFKSQQSVGCHYATFLEHPEQSIDAHEKDLKKALCKYNLSESSFWILKFGEGRYVKNIDM